VKYAIDPVGGKIGSLMVKALSRFGTLILYGVLDPAPLQLNYPDLLWKHATIHGFWMVEYATLHPEEVFPPFFLFFSVLFFLSHPHPSHPTIPLTPSHPLNILMHPSVGDKGIQRNC
jgi:hypothetical protein